ncbi:hypothetical protein PSB24_004395 [Escherichia coli]|nr:hypothetical protein [Escherichia coli]
METIFSGQHPIKNDSCFISNNRLDGATFSAKTDLIDGTNILPFQARYILDKDYAFSDGEILMVDNAVRTHFEPYELAKNRVPLYHIMDVAKQMENN